MRSASALILLGCLTVSGCALVEDATRNTVLAIRMPIAEHREMARNRHWAESAWLSVSSAGPTAYSADYADGFKDGYAEYLFRGGDGEPPLLAPLHYRKLKYQTPEGFAAIQDWFNGYRHGAVNARDTGIRQWITGPSALAAALPAAAVTDEPGFQLPMPTPLPRAPEMERDVPPLVPTLPPPSPLPAAERPKFKLPEDASRSARPDVPLPVAAETTTTRLRLTGIRAVPPAPRVHILGFRALPSKN